ncbi:MAG: pyridoxamine 5'-phosphate oxidase family protein [Ilumatobacteraceae bacterium]
MSREVEFHDVRRRVAEFGELATLVTVTGSGAPHTVSVLVDAADRTLVVAVGARTLANIVANPAVCLLWTPGESGNYQLILDGTAAPNAVERTGGLVEIAITVTMGILHRLADRSGTGPTCVALGAAQA